MTIKIITPWRQETWATDDDPKYLFDLMNNNKSTIDNKININLGNDKNYKLEKIDDEILKYIKSLKLKNITIIDYLPNFTFSR